jgi:hypothetical protein
LGVHAMGGTLAEVVGPLMAGFLLGFLDWRTTLQLSAAPECAMRRLDRVRHSSHTRLWL